MLSRILVILLLESSSLFLVPDDPPSFLEESNLKHNEIEVRWKTCALWNGPQIGYEIKACNKSKCAVHEKYKPNMYVLSSFHKVCSDFGGVT